MESDLTKLSYSDLWALISFYKEYFMATNKSDKTQNEYDKLHEEFMKRVNNLKV
jgi:hypothetical protein